MAYSVGVLLLLNIAVTTMIVCIITKPDLPKAKLVGWAKMWWFRVERDVMAHRGYFYTWRR